jgi:EmrB/QacA subfamily drug resistance transporter
VTSFLKTSARPASTNLIVFVVCLAQFMVILDVSIVNVALPSIGHGLHFSTTGLQWVINAYTITFAGFLLLGGRAADLLGRRSVFLVGTAAFALFSLVAAVSDSQATLLGARVLQGLAGAVMSPATLSIITTSTREGAERTRALGIWGAVGGLGASSGALLGGLLTQGFGWPAIFAVNVPLGAIAVVLGLRVIPAGGARDLESERHFDALGAVLVTAGLATLAFGVVRTTTLGWGAPGVLAPLAVAVVLLGAFLYVEHSVARWPLMPLSIFRVAQLRWANVIVVLMYGGLFSMFYFVTLFLQQVQGDTALIAGLSFLPCTLSVFASSNRAPRFVARFGIRATLTAGMALATVGLLWLSQIAPGSSYAAVVLPGLVLSGLGMGTALVTGTVAAMQGVPAQQAGLASGLLNTSRMVGGALGLAVLATLAASVTRSDVAGGGLGSAAGRALTDGFAQAMTVGALFTLIGGVVALTLLKRPAPVARVVPLVSVSSPEPRERVAA